MKKLSVLVALILCVTVGSVYATWNYAQGGAEKVVKYFDDSTVITPSVTDTAKGTIEVDTTGLDIVIDDEGNDYYGDMTITGKVVITFTPSEGADETVANSGIALQYSLGTTTDFTYNSNAIFTVDSAVQDLGTGKSFEIDAAKLEQLITLNDLYLPTAEDYDDFKEALHSGGISITVSEKLP